MIRKVNMMYEACMGDAIKSPADFAVYAALCFYAGEERFCAPSVRELARMLHAGHATVARGLKALEQAGLVRREVCQAESGDGRLHKTARCEILTAPGTFSGVSDAERNAPHRIFKKCDEGECVSEAGQPQDWAALLVEVAKLYRDELPELPACEKFTGRMMVDFVICLADDNGRRDLSWWRGYFALVRERPWLLGENPKGWKADIAFLVKPGKMRDILSGRKYTGRWHHGGGEFDAEAFVNELGRTMIEGWKEVKDGNDGDSSELHAM